MSYDIDLEKRLNFLLEADVHIIRKKMFGGICYQYNGNIMCGVHKDYLILRLGTELAETALNEEFVWPFNITGRTMKGWVMVDQKGFPSEEDLKYWIRHAKEFARGLPPKTPKK